MTGAGRVSRIDGARKGRTRSDGVNANRDRLSRDTGMAAIGSAGCPVVDIGDGCARKHARRKLHVNLTAQAYQPFRS